MKTRVLGGHYILGPDGEPHLCQDLLKWAKWFEDNPEKRRVAAEMIFPRELGDDCIFVSTVFLGMDHEFHPDPGRKPLLFETMVRDEGTGKWLDDFTRRYGTREEAIIGHREVCREVFESLISPGVVKCRFGR